MHIWQACQQGNLAQVKEFVSEHPEQINLKDKMSSTPLHWAALNGRFAVAKFLLESGASVNEIGGDLEAPPLHWAIW